jgi:hypothetical protein
VLKLFPLSGTIKTPSEDGIASTLSPGLTFKNSRTSLSKTTRYRSSTLSTAITHPTILAFLPRLSLSYQIEQNQKTPEFSKVFQILSPSVSLEHFGSSLVFLLRCRSLTHAKPRLQGLLPNLQGTDLSRGQISIRLPVRRQTTSLPELRRDNSRTSRVRDGVPRLLTSLQAMWLLDLRECPNETRRGRKSGRIEARDPPLSYTVIERDHKSQYQLVRPRRSVDESRVPQ